MNYILTSKFRSAAVLIVAAVTLLLSAWTANALEADIGTKVDAPQSEQSIPLDQLGAEAQQQYSGDGISINPTEEGARLRSLFQKLEGDATTEGLWITSTVGEKEDEETSDRFRIVAAGIGNQKLSGTGQVQVEADLVRFVRPDLVEEYRVSMDGIRQDFLVLERPEKAGELVVSLKVSGAIAANAAHGINLTLQGSGRDIAYSRLHVTDATGRELSARIAVGSPDELAVHVNDTAATYPVRIDPTFSDADWVSLNSGIPGADRRVRAFAVDGSGNLYAGGEFTFIGDQVANHIAKWDGNSWAPLGDGVDDIVNALEIIGSDLYAGGQFTSASGVSANRIAKWDGTSWSALGDGIDNIVETLVSDGSNLYAGGFFTMAGGSAANNIAKWNGTSWTAMGGGTNGLVSALARIGIDIYVGGEFTTVDGGAASRIAKWDGGGSFWETVGSGMDQRVQALAVVGADLYAGGEFTMAGSVPAEGVAKWDGSSWTAVGTSGPNLDVRALLPVGTDLYLKGSGSGYLYKWDGSAWSQPGPFMNGVEAMAVIGGDIYFGGDFDFASDGTTAIDARSLAKWNATEGDISALGTGLGTSVNAFAMVGNELYVGGGFYTFAGDPDISFIAKWDGNEWSAVGSGLNQVVLALVADESGNLYAGGFFWKAAGISVNGVAKWDGTNWSPLGTGISGGHEFVGSLAMSGSDLYVGGNFTSAGGNPASSIAKWDGSSWSALGSGTTGGDNWVDALVADGSGNLYVGGSFNLAGGIADTEGVAKWDGTAWSALGTGLAGSWAAAASMVMDGSGNLYVAGIFYTAGGVTANKIAKWDGSSWSALGAGLTEYESNAADLAVDRDGNLYLAGNFPSVDGVAANNIAKWDGSVWSPMGSGTDDGINELAIFGDKMLMSGYFSIAGTTVSPFLAQANLALEPVVGPPVAASVGDPYAALRAHYTKQFKKFKKKAKAAKKKKKVAKAKKFKKKAKAVKKKLAAL